MTLDIKLQQLSLELRNLSTYQLECFKDVTESAAMYVHENNLHWKGLIGKYKNSWDSVNTLSQMELKENTSWIKLTDYMYVEGVVMDKDKVLVDIGGGYFVNMSFKNAKNFFERRGACGIELSEFYDELFYRKRLVYYAIDEALNNKIQEKLDKIDGDDEVVQDKQDNINAEIPEKEFLNAEIRKEFVKKKLEKIDEGKGFVKKKLEKIDEEKEFVKEKPAKAKLTKKKRRTKTE